MKKLFLFIPAMLLALAMNAKETAVAPGTNAIKTAVAAADANDVLVLSTGTYTENSSFSINKNITIQAADGAHPVIAQLYYIKIEGGAAVTLKGLKFDGGAYGETGASDHCLRAHDSSNGNETLTLEDCEFTRFPNYIIYTQNDTRRWDAITIRNCYFHHNTKSAVLITYSSGSSVHQSCNSLTIENSTFADFSGNDYAVIYYGAPDAEHTTTLSMNHCTFYNNQKQAIEWNKSTNLAVSNCIFAQPSYIDHRSVECAGGAITNCLTYNSKGLSASATPSGNLTGNPYFVNTTSGSYDFTPATFSPAHNAGTDDKDMGDYLRWTSEDAAHATTKNITGGTDAIKAAVEAAWPNDEIVLATGTYNESASIAVDKDLTIKAADGATPTVVPVNGFAISNGSEVTIQNIKFDCTSVTSDLISVSDATAGNKLTLEGCELYNTGSHKAIHAGSSTHLDACVINDCYFHDGNNSAIHIEAGSTSHVCDRIEITNSTFANYSGFATALIQIASKDGNLAADPEDDQEIVVDHCTFYNFTKTVNDTYGFVDSRKSTNVTLSNCIMANPTEQASLPSGTHNPRASQLYGGTITNCLIYNVPNHRTEDVIPANPVVADPLFTDAANGDFTLKRSYITWEISPAYGAGTEGSTIGDPRWEAEATYLTTDFPSAGYVITAANAKLSAGTTILETNESAPTHPYIRYTHASPTGDAEWVVKATRACYVQATVNMADNTWTTDPSDAEMYLNHKHIFVVEVRDADETLIGSVKECDYNEDGSSDGIATYPTVNLPGHIYIPEAGIYTIKLRNPRNYSRCGVASVTLSYAGGTMVDVPGVGYAKDAVLEAQKMYHDENGYIHYGNYGTVPTDEYAYWMIKTTAAYSGKVLLDIPIENTSGHKFHVELYSDLAGEKSSEAYEASTSYTGGLIELSQTFNIPAAGTYYLKLINHTQWSSALLRGISLAPSITIDEDETNIETVIGVNDGKIVNAQLDRTLKADMYNTICLPFAVSDEEMSRVFSGAMVKELSSSSVEDDYILNLNFSAVSEMAAGVPYIIRPAADIVNPKFVGVTIDKTLRPKNTTNANFIGTFIQDEIPASENNLFLGANNTLYFPTEDMPILGMRAYFVIHDAPAGAIRRARIVEGGQVATEIELVNSQEPNAKSQKMLINGQLIILRDGKTYNALGQLMQ